MASRWRLGGIASKAVLKRSRKSSPSSEKALILLTLRRLGRAGSPASVRPPAPGSPGPPRSETSARGRLLGKGRLLEPKLRGGIQTKTQGMTLVSTRHRPPAIPIAPLQLRRGETIGRPFGVESPCARARPHLRRPRRGRRMRGGRHEPTQAVPEEPELRVVFRIRRGTQDHPVPVYGDRGRIPRARESSGPVVPADEGRQGGAGVRPPHVHERHLPLRGRRGIRGRRGRKDHAGALGLTRRPLGLRREPQEDRGDPGAARSLTRPAQGGPPRGPECPSKGRDQNASVAPRKRQNDSGFYAPQSPAIPIAPLHPPQFPLHPYS